jgi:hypothetical protein
MFANTSKGSQYQNPFTVFLINSSVLSGWKAVFTIPHNKWVFETVGGSTFQSGFTPQNVCADYLKMATVLQECRGYTRIFFLGGGVNKFS